MTEAHIHALRRDEGDGSVLAAPRVGLVTIDVAPGAVVQSGEPIGTLSVLGRSQRLLVPPGAPARVAEVAVRTRHAPIAYGAVLLRLAPVDALAGAAASDAGAAGLEGMRFDAPMDGQLYMRPSPDEPPFVADGATVMPGQTIALVEVMKFFYPLKWEGDAPVRLLRYVATEAAPIEAGGAVALLAPVEPGDG